MENVKSKKSIAASKLKLIGVMGNPFNLLEEKLGKYSEIDRNDEIPGQPILKLKSSKFVD